MFGNINDMGADGRYQRALYDEPMKTNDTMN